MSTPVSFNGVTYNIPGASEENWFGNNGVDGFLIAVAQNSLQKTGGLFTLAADLDFGPAAGGIFTYFKSRSSNISQTGVFRLSHSDFIGFRNNANSADLAFGVNSSDQATFNGNQLLTSLGSLTASRVVTTDGSGNLVSSSVTTTTLAFLDATSSIQTQLNSKQSTLTLPLSLANGGTGTNAGSANAAFNALSPMTTAGDVIYGGSSGVGTRLAGNTTTTKEFLTSTGTGSVAQAPAYSTIAISDLPVGVSYQNLVINGAFDFFQRGTSTINITNGNTGFLADRFYAQNGLGSLGVLQYASIFNSGFNGAQITVSTAPTTPVSSGINLVQVLDNFSTLNIYNQTASVQALIKAAANVTQVTISLVYATSEIKPTLTNVISSQTFAVNNSTFTLCQFPNISVGTNPTTSGIVAVVISASAVSSGHVSDLNNGFNVQKVMLNAGALCAPFSRAGANIQSELAMCQRYYEKTYDVGTAPGAVTQGGAYQAIFGGSVSTELAATDFYKVTKRAAPSTITIYDAAGASGKLGVLSTGGSLTNGISIAGNTVNARCVAVQETGTSAAGLLFHWTADAEI